MPAVWIDSNRPYGHIASHSDTIYASGNGSSQTPFMYPFQLWHKCVTPNQFLPSWEYASEIRMELHDGISKIPNARVHDRFLMEIFAEHGYTSIQLRHINLCRLYLKVYLLSEITTGNGTHIDSSILDWSSPFSHHDNIKWPRTHPPNVHC